MAPSSARRLHDWPHTRTGTRSEGRAAGVRVSDAKACDQALRAIISTGAISPVEMLAIILRILSAAFLPIKI